MRQKKKRDTLSWIGVQSVPRSIRANVFHVHPCTLSNGTCVAFNATGALLLLENKSKSKQLALVQEAYSTQLDLATHERPSVCECGCMGGCILIIGGYSVTTQRGGEMAKPKQFCVIYPALAATSAIASRMTCMQAIFSIDFYLYHLLITCCHHKRAADNQCVHWRVPDATQHTRKTTLATNTFKVLKTSSYSFMLDHKPLY